MATTPEAQTTEYAVGVSYGPSGLGKTTDLLYSFPRGLFMAFGGALKPAGMIGYTPTQIQAKSFMEALAVIRTMRSRKGEYDAVVFDDATVMGDATVGVLEKSYTGWALWGQLTERVLELIHESRTAGLHVWFTCHESVPGYTKSGARIRGGPKLPGQLPEKMPALMDVCVRAVPDNTRPGWPAAFYCGGPRDPDFLTKDRHGRAPVLGPMNTAEILRAGGYTLRRAVGLEWMDRVVEAVHLELYQKIGEAVAKQLPTEELAKIEVAVLQATATKLKEKGIRHAGHISWVLRDVMDRTTIRRNRTSIVGSYGVVL